MKDKLNTYWKKLKYCKVVDGKLAITIPSKISDMPRLKKQKIDINNFQYIGFQNIKNNDINNPQNKTVGFFIDDTRFNNVCKKPWNYIERLKQYKQVLSIDLSCYTNMDITEQWYNTYINRVIARYWQDSGITVIPTVSWSDEKSYKFAFLGIPKGSVVAVSTLGAKNSKELFMKGFIKMCEIIKPKYVICYCKPFDEMCKYSKIVIAEYQGQVIKRNTKNIKTMQLTLFDCIDEIKNK